MKKEKKSLLATLIVIASILAYTWTLILFTDNGASWRHGIALLLYFPLVFLFTRDIKKTIIFTGLYLILGTCNVLTLTPSITSNSYGIRIGSVEIWTPTFQLYSFLLFVLYIILNFNALIDYYLDYQDSKKLKRSATNPVDKIKISSVSAQDLVKQGKQLFNLHISGDFDLYAIKKDIPSEFVIINCIVDNLVSPGVEFKHAVYLQNSHFHNCNFYGGYFFGGLTIDNCVFESYLEFQAGGHNQNGKLFSIKNSHLKHFVNFFDCWFQSGVEIMNNRFEKGTNILGNKSQPYRVQFDVDPLIENNIGSVDLDGEGDIIANTIILNNYKE